MIQHKYQNLVDDKYQIQKAYILKQLEKLCDYFKVDISYFLMFTTTDSYLDLIEMLFESKELTSEQKEDLFTSIMKIYLDSKDK